jgi:hypothetical protein
VTDKRREGLKSHNPGTADNGNQQQYARSRLSFVKLDMPAQLLHVTQIQTAAANSSQHLATEIASETRSPCQHS